VRRLSKTAQTVLGVGIFLVLASILLMGYFQQGQAQERLAMELSSVQILLAKQWQKFAAEDLPARQSELEDLLALRESQVNVAQADLRQPIKSIEITDTFFDIAENNGVAIVEITEGILELLPPGLTGDEMEGLDFSSLQLVVKVEGDVANIVNYVLELNQQFPTSVNEVTKVYSFAPWQPPLTQATLTVNIFNYEGNQHD